MKTLKKMACTACAIAVASALVGCGDSETNKQPENLVEAPKYLELKKESLSNNRMTVRVLLREKVDTEALKSLAFKVCEDNSCKNYKRTDIFVFLPGMGECKNICVWGLSLSNRYGMEIA